MSEQKQMLKCWNPLCTSAQKCVILFGDESADDDDANLPLHTSTQIHKSAHAVTVDLVDFEGEEGNVMQHKMVDSRSKNQEQSSKNVNLIARVSNVIAINITLTHG